MPLNCKKRAAAFDKGCGQMQYTWRRGPSSIGIDTSALKRCAVEIGTMPAANPRRTRFSNYSI